MVTDIQTVCYGALMRLGVRVTKRAIDLLGAGMGLLLTAPFLPVIAAAIYFDSPGPILFKQKRAGKLLGASNHNGVRRIQFAEFHMHKFRTMRPDAEKYTGPVLAAEEDPRITRVGRFLRKTRLDELPQLWDVLRGSMSLVGPRPERPELLQQLAFAIPLFEERMRDVKPGITGLAQVSLGYTGSVNENTEIAALVGTLQNPFQLPEAAGSVADDMRIKLLYDLAYLTALEKFTAFVSMETRIILRTPLVMIRGVGR